MSVFDDNANEYDAWFSTNTKLYETEVKAVGDIMDRTKTYVEVGVGTGLFATRLGITEGVEPSPDMAKYATMRGVNVRKGVAEHLPYEDESLEGILMITVDCFVKDIRPVFSEAYRVLKDNGSYVMAFLDRGSPLGEVYEANKENDIYYKDATFRSSEEMVAYLTEAGFTIEAKSQTVYTLDNEYQPIKDGNGEGVFAIIRARKENK